MKQENYIRGMIMIILSAFFFCVYECECAAGGRSVVRTEKVFFGIW